MQPVSEVQENFFPAGHKPAGPSRLSCAAQGGCWSAPVFSCLEKSRKKTQGPLLYNQCPLPPALLGDCVALVGSWKGRRGAELSSVT